ncbi:hypothetical protein RND61_27290 [Streptomyces sp. TRM76323]|uniref:Uncharacterized protein n=1 Tax=Streptomyces tamarix TaxID=3078565 RepID=A0ABU3QST1_9ACTN|nr:hypothetical protein [Streptomyces tamarix]MDT9685742.1 hypothetical protein [Streptomyces tamarix]
MLEGSGVAVKALMVVNVVDPPIDSSTGARYGAYGGPAFAAEGVADRPALPAPEVHAAEAHVEVALRLVEAPGRGAMPPMSTTFAVAGTDGEPTRAQGQKVAGVVHDGVARAVRPAHRLKEGKPPSPWRPAHDRSSGGANRSRRTPCRGLRRTSWHEPSYGPC